MSTYKGFGDWEKENSVSGRIDWEAEAQWVKELIGRHVTEEEFIALWKAYDNDPDNEMWAG